MTTTDQQYPRFRRPSLTRTFLDELTTPPPTYPSSSPSPRPFSSKDTLHSFVYYSLPPFPILDFKHIYRYFFLSSILIQATMHFALPTRNHRSSPFLAASVPRSYFSRRKPVYALIVLVVVLILLFGRSSGPGRPADAPDTVLVLLVDKVEYSEEHIQKVIENRKSYAAAHGIHTSGGGGIDTEKYRS